MVCCENIQANVDGYFDFKGSRQHTLVGIQLPPAVVVLQYKLDLISYFSEHIEVKGVPVLANASN